MNGERKEKHVAASLEKKISLQRYLGKDLIAATVEKFIVMLTEGLKIKGCKMIGHIKGVVDSGARGALFFNCTAFDSRIRFKGDLDKADELYFGLNIIVYGINRSDLDKVLDNALDHFETMLQDY